MSSAGILMNLVAATPAAATSAVATCVAQTPDAVPGFTQALAAAQADGATGNIESAAESVSLELVSGLVLNVAGQNGSSGAAASTADGGAADAAADSADAAESGAAAILAQMLMGAAQPAPAAPPAADALNTEVALTAEGSKAASPPSAKAADASRSGAGIRSSADTEDVEDHGSTIAKSDGVAVGLRHDLPATTSAAPKPVDVSLLSTSPTPQPGAGAQTSAQAGVQASVQAGAQATMQAVATALRDSPVAQATTLHASLREHVGSARWADELGNRLVLMSVRGQQQGSLTLTPEHLGPVEVQISVNRDTTNVWFGAQHADTRAALTEAMPRLRELLAASGLSLGQSSVSEQAPREGFTAPRSNPGSAAAAAASSAEAADGPAIWRRWNPGLVDTYA